MEEEKEQMVEEVEMESMFSPNALLSPLQATPGPVLASSLFEMKICWAQYLFFESECLEYFRICLQYMFIFLYQWYLLTHRRWPRRGELLYPAALFRLLGEIFLTIMFVTPTECSRYIWTSGRHLTFKCPSSFVLSHQHKEVFILYFTYSRQLPLVMWHVVHLTIWKEIIIVWDIIQTSVKMSYRV